LGLVIINFKTPLSLSLSLSHVVHVSFRCPSASFYHLFLVDDCELLLAERAKIEAQIRVAEAASRMKEELDLKQKREREREAARAAVHKV